ncbi:FAD-dependent monooxygenase [uncultured Methylovirgula sp.]|uniref:NAD(P)/FAD-dependent oxidoreductase n=1 Tax=uncultured Methylovirgula sp. TaxID=1285960 RepID=UPI0026234DD2|nr:FAD-dependent monooxygenase [uncultured Methylovirgula sp.]
MVRKPVLVIGGGLAGAGLAVTLASAGRAVTLVERETQPHHKVCGEFVSAEAMLYLRDLGIDLESLGAVRIDKVCIIAGEKRATVVLPFPALSLSRLVLDDALLSRAVACGARVERGHRAIGINREGPSWRAALDDGSAISASDIFLATGKHDLRGWKRGPGTQNDLIGFKLHWRLTDAQAQALRSAVELFLFPGGYAGLEPIESGRVNLCLVVRRQEFFTHGQSWEAFFAWLLRICPHLRQRLSDAQPCWARPLAISTLPYGFVQRRSDGLWRLGDQAACIPSFSGDGMSIALHSARLAAHHFLEGDDVEAFQMRLAQDVTHQVRRATLLSQMLLQPFGQKAGMAAIRHLPALLRVAARATRISENHIRAARADILGSSAM